MGHAGRKGLKIVAAAAVVILLVVLILFLQGAFDPDRIGPESASAPPAKATGPVAAAREVELPQFNEAVGTFRSRHEVQISSHVMANILTLDVVPGTKVATGDLLIVLDSRDIVARLERTEAAMREAEAERARQATEFDRIARAHEQNAVSDELYDRAKTGVETTEARVRQAEQDVEETRVLLGYTRIVSPIDGVVEEKRAEVGDLAVPGRTLLVLHDPSRLRLEAAVREGCLRTVHLGDRVPVRIDTTGEIVEATISEIEPAADPASRTFLVKGDLPPSDRIRAGMFGHFLFACGTRNVVTVPPAAVRRIGQLDIVTVVSAEGVPRLRHVRTGDELDSGMEILSGLHPGEKVLLPSDEAR